MYTQDALSVVLDDSALRLPPRELRARMEAQLAGLSDLERESFDDVIRTVGSGAQAALPGVVQGASMGAAAGPWGALIGGLAGGALSLATSNVVQGQGRPASPPAAAPPAAAPPARPSYAPPQTVRPATPPAPAMPVAAPVRAPSTAPAAAPATAASGDNPAGQLLWAMQNPRVQQAIAALVAGSLGRQQVPVGDTTAPPAAFLTLLNVLASQAADRADPHAAEGQDDYLRDSEGDLAWDVVNPEARARALLAHLRADGSASRADDAGAWLLRSGLAELAPTGSAD